MAGRGKRELKQGEAAGQERANDAGVLIRVPKRVGRQRWAQPQGVPNEPSERLSSVFSLRFMDGTNFCIQSLMVTIIGECRIRIILVTVGSRQLLKPEHPHSSRR
jgi:hypothetical protein